MVVNRWHEVERLGWFEAAPVSDAALGRDSHTFEAREASTLQRQRHSRLSRSGTRRRGHMLAGIAHPARRGREQVAMVLSRGCPEDPRPRGRR